MRDSEGPAHERRRITISMATVFLSPPARVRAENTCSVGARIYTHVVPQEKTERMLLHETESRETLFGSGPVQTVSHCPVICVDLWY